eukprot:1482500-Rhodomonas_salina.3
MLHRNCSQDIPRVRGPFEVIANIFAEDPIVWVRVHDFQIESLKLVTLGILKHLPSYADKTEELAMGLTVPGEIPAMGFLPPVDVLTYAANAGAQDVAEQVQAASAEVDGSLAVSLHDAEAVLDHARGKLPAETVLLLYLNSDVFKDKGGCAGSRVQRAMDLKIKVAIKIQAAAAVAKLSALYQPVTKGGR